MFPSVVIFINYGKIISKDLIGVNQNPGDPKETLGPRILTGIECLVEKRQEGQWWRYLATNIF